MNVNLDPLTTVVRLALINYRPGPVKIGITTSGIVLFTDTWLDRSRRTLQYWLGNGCSREFLYTLRPSLEQAVLLYRDQYPALFQWAHSGLSKLKTTYNCSNVSETITLAMRALHDPSQQLQSHALAIPTLLSNRTTHSSSIYTDEEIQSIMAWLRLLETNPSKTYIADAIDVFLNGKAQEVRL